MAAVPGRINMALPTFRSLAARRQEKKAQKEERSDGAASSERTLTPTYTPGVDIKRATTTRRNAIVVASLFFLISGVFLILVRTVPPKLSSS
jgi:hypothetical protein